MGTTRIPGNSSRLFPIGFLSLLFALTILTRPTQSIGAVVTTNEAAMDAIFSQASFGTNTVDIRFNPTVLLGNTNLLTITTETEFNDLMALAPEFSPTVNMFFVDTLDWCGSFSTSIAGCAFRPGNRMIIESGIAAGGFGGELNAHELAHNLGLPHVMTPNLMSDTLNGNTDLDASQVSTILASSLIQMDGSQRFIEITPVLLVATPIPGAILFLASGAGLLGLTGIRRRRR